MGNLLQVYNYYLMFDSTLNFQDYDTDRLFPTYGFGARLSDGEIHSCFNVSLSPESNCFGVEGILYAYRNSLPLVELWGPTNFAPVINQAASLTLASINGESYFVLLILTNGAITDMDETKDALVNASSLPLSIIIVGVGHANFNSMHELDCDRQMLKSPRTGKVAERDIVQFVQFDKLQSQYGDDYQLTSYHLAKEVLAEVPQQLERYMRQRGIVPHAMYQ